LSAAQRVLIGIALACMLCADGRYRQYYLTKFLKTPDKVSKDATCDVTRSPCARNERTAPKKRAMYFGVRNAVLQRSIHHTMSANAAGTAMTSSNMGASCATE
jgi:hypothetical protein